MAKAQKLTAEDKKKLAAEFKRLRTIVCKIIPAGKKRDEIIAALIEVEGKISK